MGQFSKSFPKHFSYLCEYAIRFDLSCSFCEYSFIFHCLHCSPSCFDPDSLLLAHLWLGLSWIYCISANKSFSSPKTSSRKPYTSSKQQERQKHSVETTINFSHSIRSRFGAKNRYKSGSEQSALSDCAKMRICQMMAQVAGRHSGASFGRHTAPNLIICGSADRSRPRLPGREGPRPFGDAGPAFACRHC